MEGTNPMPLIKAFVPKLPLIGKTAVKHTLGLSQHSQHWDLRSELTITIIRSFITDSPPEPISKTQKMSLGQGLTVKGRMWICQVTLAAPPEDDIRQALFQAIEGLKEPGDAPGGYKEPVLLPVEAEWTGYRAKASKSAPEPKIPEKQKYTEMMKEVRSPTTVLYFHGGAYYLMDPATHRLSLKKLAKITGGRCISVRYRLAPQNAFPSALLDALVAYFNLLYPLPGSVHEAVSPANMVFAGDSAGGNLSLVLLQTLMEFRRQGLTPVWNGEPRETPLPAGVALCSPWLDITHSSPSCQDNLGFDYLPNVAARSAHPTGIEFPPDEIWPTSPPRNNLYAEDALLCHPLVSPIAAKEWQGAPPLYIGTGQELLTDEDKHVAAKAARQGVKVVFEEYEAMPHCFAMVLVTSMGSKRFFNAWAGFMKNLAEGGEVETCGVKVYAKTLEEEKLVMEEVGEYNDEEVVERMRERVAALEKTAEKVGKGEGAKREEAKGPLSLSKL